MASIKGEFYRMAAWAGAVDVDEELKVAAKNGQTDKVNALIEAGANVHSREDYAVREAAAAGHTDTVKALIRAGAAVHARDDEALRWAAENGHPDTVKVLLAVPLDVEVARKRNMAEGLAYLAEEKGHGDTAQALRVWSQNLDNPVQQAPMAQPKVAAPRPM